MNTSVALLLLAGLLVLGVEAQALTIHVATDGDDTWSGRFERPNAERTDGPVATLAGARNAVRRLRAAGGQEPVEVQVQDGTYRITEPFLLTPLDGGGPDAPVLYTAAPGARPVISGGKPISGFTRGEGGLWVAEVPEVAAGTWSFNQLWVNGRRAIRARTPNFRKMEQEWLYAAGPLPGIDPRQQRGDEAASIGFTYRPGDLRRWDRFDELVVYAYHSWTTSVHWVAELDEEQRTVKFTNRSGWPLGYWDRAMRYYVENCLEFLDDPGEWYLDRSAGRLYYLPREGEDMTTAEVIAPVARQLVRIIGDAAIGQPVSHVTFRGLSFQHADWWFPKTQSLDGQSCMFLDGAIHTLGARDCRFEDCEVAHVGGYGIRLDRGTQDCLIQRCHIHDLGGGGVRIGEVSTPENETVACDRNTVDNCFIHDGGNVWHAGCGVIINRASYNTITHNEICDFYYTGISCGWSWGYAPTSAHDNVIEYNHVHHLGWGELSDMGGIYTLGVSPGTRVNHNVFHDILSYSYGGWGLYTDEGSTDIEMAYNVVYNTKTGGFHQHYGQNNHIHHNVLAFSAESQVQRTRAEDHLSFTFDHNIVYFDSDSLFSGNWSGDQFALDHNCYWHVSGEEPDFPLGDFAAWQAKGFDRHSIIADPLFVDPANHDYRLRPDSPALALGIESIDVSSVGLYGDPAWVALPSTVKRPTMVFRRPTAPEPVDDDFESTAVGERAARAQTSGEDAEKGASIRVTDETAAGGAHSLKFTDAPGLDRTWQPHLYYNLSFRRGVARGSFHLRVEEGAKLYHEWRDAANPYNAGPSVHIEPDGRLHVGGRTLLTLPHGRWVHFEIVCKLGGAADGTFDLVVTPAGEAPQRFDGLPCVKPAFRRLQWAGWSSEATDTRVFYLDNVKIGVD